MATGGEAWAPSTALGEFLLLQSFRVGPGFSLPFGSQFLGPSPKYSSPSMVVPCSSQRSALSGSPRRVHRGAGFSRYPTLGASPPRCDWNRYQWRGFFGTGSLGSWARDGAKEVDHFDITTPWYPYSVGLGWLLAHGTNHATNHFWFSGVLKHKGVEVIVPLREKGG